MQVRQRGFTLRHFDQWESPWAPAMRPTQSELGPASAGRGMDYDWLTIHHYLEEEAFSRRK